MPKTELPHPEYESLNLADCETAIKETETLLAQKAAYRHRTEEEKKDTVAGYNDTLKITKEEIAHYCGVRSALEDRKRQLTAVANGPATTGPLPPPMPPTV
jgi:hypothetical protein